MRKITTAVFKTFENRYDVWLTARNNWRLGLVEDGWNYGTEDVPIWQELHNFMHDYEPDYNLFVREIALYSIEEDKSRE